MTSRPAPNYTLCTTYQSVAVAAVTLSRSSILILDCEARDIARSTGVLSILSISDVDAKTIFLIDALALTNPSKPALRRLLDLLRSEQVTKLVWDGRSDAVELRETYGVELRGVLDLQLAEVVSRKGARKESGGVRRRRLAMRYFKPLKQDISRNPAEYDGIHQVCGMNACLQERGIKDNKDAAVVALHQAGEDPDMWLRRPLPQILLQYAAHDLELISQLYSDFLSAGWVNGRNLPLLKEQSQRYIRTYHSRAVRELYDARGLSRFVSLHVLDKAPIQSSRYECEGCKQQLIVRWFTTVPWSGGRTQYRSTFCKLCVALAKRNAETSMGEWVAM